MTRIIRMVDRSFICIVSIVLSACSNHSKKSIDRQQENINKEQSYGKISDFIDMYSREDMIKYYREKKNYPIEDSVCLYFSRLNLHEVIKDDDFKYLAGKLLERQYLEVRNSGQINPESFPVYNVILWTHYLLSHRFALKIIIDFYHDMDSGFTKYANIGIGRDFLCIDSVVLILDKLPQMQNDSIHFICKDLVETDRTGGCRW